jgi:hypothetical protein
MDPKEGMMSKLMRGISVRAAVWAALGLLATGVLPLGPAPAQAQVQAQGAPAACGARDGLLSHLENKYGEVPVAIGVAGGALIELLTTKDGLTWTLILTSPQGISCLIASGEGWRPLAPAPSGPSV